MAGRDLFATEQAPKGRNLFAIGDQDGISVIDSGGVGAVQVDRQVEPISGGLGEEAARKKSFPGASFLEPAAALISGALAESIAGLRGIVTGSDPQAEQGAAARAVESTREALTFQPRTEEGKAGLQAVGEFLEPVAEGLKTAETFLGDETFEATGSPALAAAATTIPTALLEAVGFAAGKGILKTGSKTKEALKEASVKRAVVESAPDIEQLKSASRAVYKEIDEVGATLKKGAYRRLVDQIKTSTRKAGIDKDITPKATAALNRLESELGKAQSLTEIDTLRKVAQNAASAIDPADARIGAIMVGSIDEFLDTLSPNSLKVPSPVNVAPKYRVARELWGRARRSELINEAFEKAKNQASGFENGLVVQFRTIINNRKKSRFFKPKELDAMRKVVRGTTSENIAKLIGRLGFSEGHATNILGGSIGIAAGAAVGGPIGAVAVPVIGQVSRKLAQRLTRGNAEFADTVVRAGSNADEIVKAYLKNTPKGKRSPVELSELLLRPDINLDAAMRSKNLLLRDAAETAKGMKILKALSATTAVGAPGAVKEIQE